MSLVVLIDGSDRLSPIWKLGLSVNRTKRDLIAHDAVEAAELLYAAYAERPFTELHVWGHGSSGAPLIGRHILTPSWAKMPDLSLVWWRSCSVHRGGRGMEFAQRLADQGITSVGHCDVISAPNPLWQKAICALRPGESPWWHPEGRGLPGCSALRMTVPHKAYRD